MSPKQSKKNETNNVLVIIITIVVLLLILLFTIFSLYAKRIKPNPEGTIGNTAGNINNSGLFCEYNDVVYFSNPTDGGTLYSMNPDETQIRKLGSMKVCNVLAGGEYLYYFQFGSAEDAGIGSVATTHSFVRNTLNGNNPEGLTRDVIVSGQLVDNYLYLLSSGKKHPVFYKLKIDKSDSVTLAEYNINPACAYNGMIYYNGTQDNHALYRLNTANDVTEVVWNGNIWNPVISGDYIYYMDLSSDYRLCRYSLSNQSVEILTKDRVDCFNVGSGFVYYQKNDETEPQLKCMHTDGSNNFVLAEGIYTNINMTSQYVYFQEFGNDDSLYHSSLGSGNYSAVEIK